MNDMLDATLVKTVADAADENQAETNDNSLQREAQVRSAVAALSEARQQACALLDAIDSISSMLPSSSVLSLSDEAADAMKFVRFSAVSKEVRNAMLDKLMICEESVSDSIKAAHRAVKSVKRSRLTDEQIDQLVIRSRI